MNFFINKGNNLIQCTACARYCEIENGGVGYCGVRKNVGEKLKLLTYANIIHLKRIDRKMLVGSFGSNMRIPFDPYWDISLFPYLNAKEEGREKTNEKIETLGYKYSPSELVEYVKKQNCDEIVFQFNEPLVNIEYILDVCRIGGLKISLVTTGYFSKESLKEMLSAIDEISIIFFSPFDKFYIKHCKCNLPVIKKNIEMIFKSKTNLKILCPLIPEESDVLSICKFLKSISTSLQITFLKFQPSFRMLDKRATRKEELIQAVEIAKKVGLKNVDFIS